MTSNDIYQFDTTKDEPIREEDFIVEEVDISSLAHILPEYTIVSAYPMKVHFVIPNKNTFYRFTSIGHKGCIEKEIGFYKLQMEPVEGRVFYKLDYGDRNFIPEQNTFKTEFFIKSVNGDVEKIMYALSIAFLDFCFCHPEAVVFFDATTKSRIRLNQMYLNKYFYELSTTINIFGSLNNEWVPFQKGVNYENFIIELRPDI